MLIYSNTLSLLVVMTFALLVWRAPIGQRGRAADTLLAGLALALLLGRALHVAVHWAYFQDHLAEIPQWTAGGLSWQGAAWGALIGCGVVGRARGLRWPQLATGLALAAPLLALGAWYGCQHALCAHGAEVSTLADYPAWLVVDARDRFGLYAPRFNTHPIGIGLMLLTLLGVWALRRLPPLRLLGISLALVALSNLSVGFLRGDMMPMAAGLRLDQWLDLAVLLTALGLIAGSHRRLMISSV